MRDKAITQNPLFSDQDNLGKKGDGVIGTCCVERPRDRELHRAPPRRRGSRDGTSGSALVVGSSVRLCHGTSGSALGPQGSTELRHA